MEKTKREAYRKNTVFILVERMIRDSFMKISRALLVSIFLALVLAGIAVPVQAEEGGPSLVNVDGFQPSNYCLSCHTSGDRRLEAATVWIGDIEREATSPCPAHTRLHEELYYTERLMLAIDNARAGLPGSVDMAKVDARVAAAQQTYSRLLDSPTTSLDAFTSEAQMLRFRLGKSYSQINQINEGLKRQRVLLYSGLVSVVVVLSLGWGWWNTQKGIRRVPKGTARPRSGLSTPRLALVLGIFIVFSLPIFRIPAQEVVTPSAEEQARQAALDTAERSSGTADRELARAWMLARVGAAWSAVDPQQATLVLADALDAARSAKMNASALWGEAQSAHENAAGEAAAQDKAVLIASQLDATRSRAWGLRLIAEEWAAIDSDQAEMILEDALTTASEAIGFYHDLDARAIAVTWATIDPARGLAVASQVGDPGLHAWALREIASLSGDAALFDQATEIARGIEDPIQRARALREIAVASGDKALFYEALVTLEEADGAAQAYALSDLAAASGDESIADRIDEAYPAARAAALYRLGEFEGSWDAAADISDPFEQARAQATIAALWGNAEAARRITIPLFRDLALRDISIKSGDVSLAESIQIAYYKVQALTALGQYQAAWEGAGALDDVYPLVELGVAWAEIDPQAALAVVDAMDREADKAIVLRAIAVATGDPDIFERALGMALAARVRGDATAPVETSISLGQAFIESNASNAEAAYTQAYEAAERMLIKYR